MRIRIMFYLILAGILGAIMSPKFYDVDPELEVYLDVVEVLSEGNLAGISRAGFVEYDKEAARCYHAWEEIRIDKEYWTKTDDRGRILLLAHEVGHCKKDCRHIDGLDSNGCAEHFMHYSTNGSWCNDINWDKYVKQMKELDC